MKKTRTEEIVDALLDLGRDILVQGIKSMREGRKIVEKAKKVDELIIDADFEDIPVKALQAHAKGRRRVRVPKDVLVDLETGKPS